tara:strand:- start:414 stop:1019 length:606 start_codon:yes stop_codon:yes gene_type:complete
MFKLNLIGGEPCSGKSTIVKYIKEFKKVEIEFKYKKIVRGYHSKDNNYCIIGVYEGGIFDGTDRLSMSVQPVLIEWIKENKENYKNVYLEGDRVFKSSFIDSCKQILGEINIIIIKTTEENKKERHKLREDNQSDKWLKAKKTSVYNIENKYKTIIFNNDSIIDKNEIANRLLSKAVFENYSEPIQKDMFDTIKPDDAAKF